MEESTRVAELVDFSRYILFYLQAVANEHNLSLIFHIAQRVKQTRDGITKTDEMSTRLHTLSDLAQATIRRFADIYSQQRKFGGAAGGTNILQTYPGKMGVPSSIFAPMGSHREAQEVADKNFFPEEGEDLLDRIVRSVMRTKSGSHGSAKKRKPESAEAGGDASATKKARKDKEKKPARPRKSSGSAGTTRTPKKKKKDDDGWSSDEGAAKKASTAARRRSSRGASRRVSYADRDSDEDDMEMDEWEEEQADEQEEAEEDGGADSEEDNDSVDLPDKEAALDEILSDREDSPLSSPPPTSPQKPTEQAPSKPSGNGKRTSTLPNRRSSRRG